MDTSSNMTFQGNIFGRRLSTFIPDKQSRIGCFKTTYRGDFMDEIFNIAKTENDDNHIKIGNTTFEIERHFVGTRTYEEVVMDAIKRASENG